LYDFSFISIVIYNHVVIVEDLYAKYIYYQEKRNAYNHKYGKNEQFVSSKDLYNALEY